MHVVLAQVGEASWPEIFDIFTFRGGWNSSVALLGTTLLGIAAGLVGTFSLLRKRALMGDALSHATLPGVCVAFIIMVALGGEGRSVPLLLFGAACSGVLGVLTVQAITKWSRIQEDAAIGIVLSVFFGVGVVLLSRIQSMDVGTQGGLSRFIMGQTAGMSRRDAMIMGGAALVALFFTFVFFKEFRVICFDRPFAQSQGWPVQTLDLVLMGLVVLVTVVGIQAVGMLLIVALLIIPPAAARFWSERLSVVTILSALIGGISGYLGVITSSIWSDMPAGAVIVLASGSIFVFSFVFAPQRGVISGVVNHLRLRTRIACDHVLRLMLEATEEQHGISGPVGTDVKTSRITHARSWSPLMLALALGWLRFRGMLDKRGASLVLTTQGATAAARVTRNHRIWERFLVTHADLAVSHVDRSADMVEHVLSAEMIAKLEQDLALDDPLPPSIHAIGEDSGQDQDR